MTADELLSLTGIDVPWPESLPIPADEPTNAGDLWQSAGLYRKAADTLSSLAIWKYRLKYPKFFMAKPGKNARLAWQLTEKDDD